MLTSQMGLNLEKVCSELLHHQVSAVLVQN